MEGFPDIVTHPSFPPLNLLRLEVCFPLDLHSWLLDLSLGLSDAKGYIFLHSPLLSLYHSQTGLVFQLPHTNPIEGVLLYFLLWFVLLFLSVASCSYSQVETMFWRSSQVLSDLWISGDLLKFISLHLIICLYLITMTAVTFTLSLWPLWLLWPL